MQQVIEIVTQIRMKTIDFLLHGIPFGVNRHKIGYKIIKILPS